MTIRPTTPDDLPAISAIRALSPEAGQWEPVGDCLTALMDGEVAGFLLTRQTAPGEREILNMAVHPTWRRKGVAKELLGRVLNGTADEWFLEVRESNLAAQNLYKSLGFSPVGRRENYYDHPRESGIVMRFFSWYCHGAVGRR